MLFRCSVSIAVGPCETVTRTYDPRDFFFSNSLPFVCLVFCQVCAVSEAQSVATRNQIARGQICPCHPLQARHELAYLLLPRMLCPGALYSDPRHPSQIIQETIAQRKEEGWQTASDGGGDSDAAFFSADSRSPTTTHSPSSSSPNSRVEPML